MPRVLQLRNDLEASAPIRVEQAREDRWRIELRQTEERNPAVEADQRDGLQIADDPVRLDWGIASLDG